MAPPPTTRRRLVELQTQLDEFCRIYNYERPHQGIGRVTPISRWHAGTPIQPATEPIEPPNWPARPRHSTVTANGNVSLDKQAIHIGVD